MEQVNLWSLLLGIFGVVATIVSTIIAVVLYRKRKKYPRRLSFYLFEKVQIVNDKAFDFKEVSILHKGNKTNNLAYIKGILISDGDEDIKCVEKEEYVSLKLSGNNKWLDVHCTLCNEGVNANVKIESTNSVTISFKSLKRDEIIQIEGFIDADDSKQFSQGNFLKLTDRIYNTNGSIKVQKLKKRDKSDKIQLRVMPKMTYVMLIIMFALSYYSMSSGTAIRYTKIDSDENELVRAFCQNDSVVLVSPIDWSLPWNTISMTPKEFMEDYQIVLSPDNSEKCVGITLFVFFGLMFLLILVLDILMTSDLKREKNIMRLYDKLSSNQEDDNKVGVDGKEEKKDAK